MAHNTDAPLRLLPDPPEEKPECIHNGFGITEFAVTLDAVCIPLDPYRNKERRTTVDVGHGLVKSRVYPYQFRERVELRGNAATILGTRGLAQVPVDRLPELIRHSIDRLGADFVIPPDSVSQARVTELTITRDLAGVTSPDSWIRSLAQVPVARCRSTPTTRPTRTAHPGATCIGRYTPCEGGWTRAASTRSPM